MTMNIYYCNCRNFLGAKILRFKFLWDINFVDGGNHENFHTLKFSTITVYRMCRVIMTNTFWLPCRNRLEQYSAIQQELQLVSEATPSLPNSNLEEMLFGLPTVADTHSHTHARLYTFSSYSLHSIVLQQSVYTYMHASCTFLPVH